MLSAEGKPPLEKLQNAKNRPYDKWRGRAIRERFPGESGPRFNEQVIVNSEQVS